MHDLPSTLGSLGNTFHLKLIISGQSKTQLWGYKKLVKLVTSATASHKPWAGASPLQPTSSVREVKRALDWPKYRDQDTR